MTGKDYHKVTLTGCFSTTYHFYQVKMKHCNISTWR